MARDTPIEDEIMRLLNRIDSRISELPSADAIREHWAYQKELYLRSQEGWKLEEDSRNLLRAHIEDMSGLRKMQVVLAEQNGKLAATQDRLATILENINDNLKNGFELGASVVKLFGKIVFIFLASLVVLALVIVWIARIDISHEKGKTSIHHRMAEGNLDDKAPSVDFIGPPTP